MAKQREILGPDPNDSNKVRVRVVVDDRGTDKVHEYSMFKDAETFRQAIIKSTLVTADDLAKMDDRSQIQATLNWFYDKYDYSLGLEERATVRDAIAAESTVIKVDKKDVDLMDLPVERLVFGINGAEAMEAVGKEVPKAFVVAKRKLIEKGAAKIDANGVLVPVV